MKEFVFYVKYNCINMLLVRVGKYHKYISLKAKRKIKSEKMTGHEGACFDYNIKGPKVMLQCSVQSRGHT